MHMLNKLTPNQRWAIELGAKLVFQIVRLLLFHHG
jgi:hypothetical protein